MTDEVIKVGKFIIIQKQNYKKLHKLNKPNSSVTMGRDSINLTGIEGCPYFSLFKMMPKSKKGREYRLELTNEVVTLKDEIDIKESGTDNRNIHDDGRSQRLTHSEIEELTYDAHKASDIVETLISNSKTFHNKTGYSQEKYLKKKEKKYFEYVQILKPNLRLIAEILYRLDPGKVQGIRIDTLSQIITMSNINSEGNHLLYDSGSNGLMAATLLNVIGAKTNGKLIHMHPGNVSQKHALLAMNFSEEHFNRCINVNIYSVLRQFYQGNMFNIKSSDKSTVSDKDSLINNSESIESEVNILKRKAHNDIESEHNHKNKVPREVDSEEFCIDTTIKENYMSKEKKEVPKEEISEENCINNITIENATNEVSKEENSEEYCNDTTTIENGTKKEKEPKKPKWYYDNIAASEILHKKMDSLIITCKEDPHNIFLELMPFVKPGRPFVIYFVVAEPLQNLYMVLKSNPKIGALKLSCNWLRNYQILPERTHPEVTMNGQSGFLLTGYVLD